MREGEHAAVEAVPTAGWCEAGPVPGATSSLGAKRAANCDWLGERTGRWHIGRKSGVDRVSEVHTVRQYVTMEMHGIRPLPSTCINRV